MPKLKLTYFDMNGGRGEAARLAMFIGGIPFEDDRVPFAEWPMRKSGTPFGGIPVLEVDGRSVAQSNAINRFVAKLAGLYPADPFEAALCDEAMDAVEEMTGPVVATFSIADPVELKTKRQALVDGALTVSLSALEQRLKEHGGAYFADGRITVADLKAYVWIRLLRSGKLDHIPTDLVDRVAPLLAKHCEQVQSHPQVRAYYEQRGAS